MSVAQMCCASCMRFNHTRANHLDYNCKELVDMLWTNHISQPANLVYGCTDCGWYGDERKFWTATDNLVRNDLVYPS